MAQEALLIHAKSNLLKDLFLIRVYTLKDFLTTALLICCCM